MNKNPIFALLWLLLLVFIAWPVAGFCAGIWIFLQVRLIQRKRNRSTIIVHSLISFKLQSLITHTLAHTLFPRSLLNCTELIITTFNSRLKLALTLSSKLPRFWKSSSLGPVTAAWRS
jgi:hypothetical protein